MEHILMGGGRPLRESDIVTLAVETVGSDPALFEELIAHMLHPDPGIARRAAKAVDVLTAKDHARLAPYKNLVLEQLPFVDSKPIQWKTALFFGRLDLTPEERVFVVEKLFEWLDAEGSVLPTCAIEGLAVQAMEEPSLREEVIPVIDACRSSGTPAMKVRARMMLERLGMKE